MTSDLAPQPSSAEGAANPAQLLDDHVRFGAGRLSELGEVVRELGGERPLIVTDPGIVNAGHAARAARFLSESGLQVGVFDATHENPTESDVAVGAEAASAHRADCLVGIGGGSAMDCCKGINFIVTNGGRMEDYWGHDLAQQPMLPSVGVPSTAGTGSEAQSYALISRDRDHRKMACGDQKARFSAVILDPELVQTAPREVARLTGLDAVSHAVESAVTTRRTEASLQDSLRAWRLLDSAFATVAAGTADVGTLGRMQLGAHFAGRAIEASMLGAAHACANPLTARFGTTHGLAVAILLPHVVAWNAAEVSLVCSETYADLARASEETAGTGVEDLVERLGELLEVAEQPRTLREIGVSHQELGTLAQQAAEQWTGGFNPRPFDTQGARELYEAAF